MVSGRHTAARQLERGVRLPRRGWNVGKHGLEQTGVLPSAKPTLCTGAASKYDLVANLVHDGAAGRGAYRAHIQRRSEGTWYEVQDLHVVDILPQARPCKNVALASALCASSYVRMNAGCPCRAARALVRHACRQASSFEVYMCDLLPSRRWWCCRRRLRRSMSGKRPAPPELHEQRLRDGAWCLSASGARMPVNA